MLPRLSAMCGRGPLRCRNVFENFPVLAGDDVENPMSVDREALKRRRFLELGLAAGTAGALISCGRAGGGPYWRFFTAAEARTVNSSRGADHPGRRLCGCCASWRGQLHRSATGQALQETPDAYRKASRTSRRPAAVALKDLCGTDAGAADRSAHRNPGESGEFFDLIRAHTMQGYYGIPATAATAMR